MFFIGNVGQFHDNELTINGALTQLCEHISRHIVVLILIAMYFNLWLATLFRTYLFAKNGLTTVHNFFAELFNREHSLLERYSSATQEGSIEDILHPGNQGMCYNSVEIPK